ncbi:MAG TPA: GTPase ObgE [Candidatus Paceibacterota bacterium]
MLIDNVTIRVKAGNGGDGKAAFNSNMNSLGPVGGDGGKGGDIYCEGTSDLNALIQFRNKKEVKTENGGNGRGQSIDGKDGEDLILKVPVGTVIANIESGSVNEIVKKSDKILIAQGGHGGIGNFKFRSATNTSPKEFTRGKPGEEFTIRFELKLIADVGLVGLPNAGKSSLLNELTNAKSKVANYPFTTLEPNLGVYYELIIADIPGLIEGASSGKGLGIKFLKHIERTNTLFHLISAESEDATKDYAVIRKELKNHSLLLAEKPEYIFVTKSDKVTSAVLKNKINLLKKINKNILAISIHDQDSITQVKNLLNKLKS